MPNELIFKRAGHIELIRASDSKRYLAFGKVMSVVPNLTNNETELEDGNSDFPMTYSAGKAGAIAVNLNSFVPHIYAALASMVQTISTYDIRRIVKATVPADPHKVDVKDTIKATTLVVHDAADSPFVSGTGVGKFSYTGSEVTFNVADLGKELTLAYDVAKTNASKAALAQQTNNPVFKAIFAGEAVLQSDEGTTKHDTVIFNRVTPVGELAMPPRQKTPAGWSFNLKVLPPGAGLDVVEYYVES